MISVSVAANSFLTDLLRPGKLNITPAPASTTTARRTPSLPPDDFRRGGRWTSGRVRVDGELVAVDGLCREKFMEGLPLVVGHDAEVAVQGQPRELERQPAHHQ